MNEEWQQVKITYDKNGYKMNNLLGLSVKFKLSDSLNIEIQEDKNVDTKRI